MNSAKNHFVLAVLNLLVLLPESQSIWATNCLNKLLYKNTIQISVTLILTSLNLRENLSITDKLYSHKSKEERWNYSDIRGCILKFPDWPPGARTTNGTVFCNWVKFYRYFVSQSSEFCCHNPLCCYSTSVCCCCLFRYDSVRKFLDTPS
jgi:hypothetical protein